jgi:hypothetical protein
MWFMGCKTSRLTYAIDLAYQILVPQPKSVVLRLRLLCHVLVMVHIVAPAVALGHDSCHQF